MELGAPLDHDMVAIYEAATMAVSTSTPSTSCTERGCPPELGRSLCACCQLLTNMPCKFRCDV